ncbi:MAG: hypothetical protein WBN04_03685 [Paracoccaceae bacterium]
MVAGSESTDRCTPGAARARRKIVSLAALGAALLLSACEAPGDRPLTYRPPAPDATMTVGLGADTLKNSVATVSHRLSKAGVKVLSANKSSGLIRARAKDMVFLDCGRITQKSRGTIAQFDGNSDRAVIVAEDFPAGLVLREISAKNTFDILVLPGDVNTARIKQTHALRARTSTADRSRVYWTDRQIVSDDSVVIFPDHTKCTSSDVIASIVRG